LHHRLALVEVRPIEIDLMRLEKLSRIDYERCRELEAKTLGIPVSALDDEVERRRKTTNQKREPGFLEAPEPWGEPVDGAELLDEIAGTLIRYVVLPDHAASAIALWVVMAHTIDSFEILPKLAIESPEKRCGKTTLLALIQAMVPKPLPAANLTAPTVFRAVGAYKPTLVVDEADTFLSSDKPELVGVLNSGHTKATAFVPRLVGDNHELKLFSTWCPKVIALIGELPTTLQDRSIVVRMRRRQKGESVERRRGDRLGPLIELCRKAARWAADHASDLRRCDPYVPSQLDDRASDNWRPLLAIAETIGGGWPAEARSAALALSGARADDDETGGVRLLADCREVLGEWLTPAALVDKLVALPEAPWSEWRHGRPISTKGVARLLKPFEIRSRQDRGGGAIARRYYRDSFKDAWERYLPDAPGRKRYMRYSPAKPGTISDFIRYRPKISYRIEAAKSPGKPGLSQRYRLQRGRAARTGERFAVDPAASLRALLEVLR
jgi:putative DNA primase/helicase